jgi:hypothetical protein
MFLRAGLTGGYALLSWLNRKILATVVCGGPWSLRFGFYRRRSHD